MFPDTHVLQTRGTQARIDQLFIRIKAIGYRITPQRVALLQLVLTSQEHLTVEQIYAKVKADFPMTSLATVYNTLALLKEMGEVLEIDLGHKGSHYDGYRVEPHPHIICIKCNAVNDADIPTLQTISQEMIRSTGYEILSHRLDFFGICPQCQSDG